MDEVQQNRTTKLIAFRVSPEDERDVKEAAARQRTNVSSIIRGSLLKTGILKNDQGEEVPNA
jgi:uncharacterized protein (DUF1778 family)